MPAFHLYLDDLLLHTNSSYEDHLKKLNLVLKQLSHVGFAVNADKTTWCTDQPVEYLIGFLLDREVG